MKYLKNLKNLLIILWVPFALWSCTNYDPEPELKEVTFDLFNQTMAVPEPLILSDNDHAHDVWTMIQCVNPTTYSAMFVVPPGATKINGTVTGVNARTNTNIATYVWYSERGSYAYQITEQTDFYFYEIFIKLDGRKKYYKWYEGIQTKDKSSGELIVLNPYASKRIELIKYEYEIGADKSLVIDYKSRSYNLVMLIKSDKSGKIERFNKSGKHLATYTWDSAGNGSWTCFDEEGQEISSGSWTV